MTSKIMTRLTMLGVNMPMCPDTAGLLAAIKLIVSGAAVVSAGFLARGFLMATQMRRSISQAYPHVSNNSAATSRVCLECSQHNPLMPRPPT